MTGKWLAALAATAMIAGAGWAGELFPFNMAWDDAGKGSITDLSSWNAGPAGAKGFISVKNGHLYEGDQRFQMLGVNVVFGSAAPQKADAEAAAARLARFGVNIVRFHHMDTAPVPNGIMRADGRTIDPDMLDRVDYFIAALKRHGIYADLNLHVGREYPELGKEWTGGPSYWKGVDNFEPRAIASQKQFAREILTHRNPYTGNTYANEPAVAIVEVNNENGLISEWQTGSLDGMTGPVRQDFAARWQAWLKARYGDNAHLKTAWNTQSAPMGAEMFQPTLGPDQPGWVLQTLGTAKGSLTAVRGGLAVALTAKGAESWHTQLHQQNLKFEADKPYTLRLMLRADHPMTITISAMQNHEPWTSLWSTRVSVGTDWQTVNFVIAPAMGDNNARLTIGELGHQTGRLDVAMASLKPGGTTGLKPGESLAEGTIDITPYTDRTARTVAAQRDWLEFMWDTETQYWGEMQRFLKTDLGVKSLIVGTQNSYSPAPIQALHDVVDAHAYWEHPQFPGRAWDQENWRIQNTPMAGVENGGTIAGLALQRVPGKPFIVTEYNEAAPSFYQGEAMPLLSAYGAMQDWDGLFLFCYGDWDSDWHLDYINGFFDSRANPVKLASLITSAAMLRRGDVRAASAERGSVPPKADWIEAMRRHPGMPGGDDFGTARSSALARSVSVAPDGKPAPAFPVVSETGELSWGLSGIGGKTVVIDSARSKGLIGARLGQVYDAHGVGLQVTEARRDFGVLLATVVEGTDFISPGRILVTALGQEENTAQRWTDDSHTSVGRNWGRAPVLVEGIGGVITLPVAATRVSAWALDPSGKRTVALPVEGTTKARITIGERYRTLWYEIEIR